MALLDAQETIVKLYLTSGVRSLVASGDLIPLFDLSISSSLAKELAGWFQQNDDRVELFSGMLLRKKIDIASRFFPLLSSFFTKSNWDEFILEYLHSDMSKSEIIDFETFRRIIVGRPELENHGAVLMSVHEFEIAQIKVLLSNRADPSVVNLLSRGPDSIRPFRSPSCEICCLDFDIKALIEYVSSGRETSLEKSQKPEYYLVFNQGDVEGPLGIALISKGLASIMIRADGKATIAELAEMLDVVGEEAWSISTLWNVIAPLAARGLVGFR